MKNKINVAELLKDCPKGMEFDCTMYDNVKLDSVDNKEKVTFPIRILREDGNFITLTKYGQYIDASFAKCVIFPKGKTTWEGFVPPCMFEDGDIVATNSSHWIGITTGGVKLKCIPTYCVVKYNGKFEAYLEEKGTWGFERLATEEEKQKLFKAIKDNGYRWNAETKTLEKLIKPKFKVGDWIMIDKPCQIISINDNGNYIVQYCDDEKTHELSKNFCESHFYRWTIQDAKDGDVLTTDTVYFIFKSTDKLFCYMHCNYSVISNDFNTSDTAFVDSEYVHPATTEQRDILFQKIKETGYKWNKETKTLEKLIKPKFKVGDCIRLLVYNNVTYTVIDMTGTHYTVKSDGKYVCEYSIPISTQDKYELAPKKFDVNTLKPFDKVLVRTERFTPIWTIAFYDGYQPEIGGGFRPFGVVNGEYFQQCIPYEGNEHLRGTTNDCDDFYKNW